MFQFRAFPSYAYLIQRTIRRYCLRGFPHSEISGSTDICSSPKLIAACHVLLRLLMPRHSPCALIRLTLRPRGFRYLSHKAFASRSLAPPQFFGSLLNYASTLFYRSFSKLLPTLTLFKLKSFSQFPLCCFAFPLFSFQSAIPREYCCTL